MSLEISSKSILILGKLKCQNHRYWKEESGQRPFCFPPLGEIWGKIGKAQKCSPMMEKENGDCLQVKREGDNFVRNLLYNIYGQNPLMAYCRILSPMHGQNVEFGHLIPGKFCFWWEIFAILREHLSLRWIFWSFSYKNVWKFVKKLTFLTIFWPYIPGKFCIFPALLIICLHNPYVVFHYSAISEKEVHYYG